MRTDAGVGYIPTREVVVGRALDALPLKTARPAALLSARTPVHEDALPRLRGAHVDQGEKRREVVDPYRRRGHEGRVPRGVREGQGIRGVVGSLGDERRAAAGAVRVMPRRASALLRAAVRGARVARAPTCTQLRGSRWRCSRC